MQEKAKSKKASAGGKKDKHPVIGIGASARGIEALETFFVNLPAQSGLSFVVITDTDK
ncbi:MAG: hypothetical protein K9K88_12130 [Desulfobacterales bacterium]|nr:hypothetical protein [Desulfobacterales bacterium]